MSVRPTSASIRRPGTATKVAETSGENPLQAELDCEDDGWLYSCDGSTTTKDIVDMGFQLTVVLPATHWGNGDMSAVAEQLSMAFRFERPPAFVAEHRHRVISVF